MRCLATQGAVRATVVVNLPPVLDDCLGFMHRTELLAGQTFVSKATIEAFVEALR